MIKNRDLVEGIVLRLKKDYRFNDTAAFLSAGSGFKFAKEALEGFSAWIVDTVTSGDKAGLTGLFSFSLVDEAVEFKVSPSLVSAINEKDAMGVTVRIPSALLEYVDSNHIEYLEEDQLKRAMACVIEQIVKNLILHRDVSIDKLGVFRVGNEFAYHRDGQEAKGHKKTDEEVSLTFSFNPWS